MFIRPLTAQDGFAYQELRLHSLKSDSHAFLSTYQNELKLHEETFANHLNWAYDPPHYGYFGIFQDDRLVGYVQVARTNLEKQEHIASLHNLYLLPEYRGQGLASALFEHIFDLLKKTEKVERVFLSCRAKNKAAMAFYKKMGFKRYAVKARAVKWEDEYDDEVEMVKVL
jgi:ribosomal protein S18 acetylase RimI-like enzyme